MKSLWKDLLFMHGHVTDPRLFDPPAEAPTPPPSNVFALPIVAVTHAQIDDDPAIHAKAWRDCA